VAVVGHPDPPSLLESGDPALVADGRLAEHWDAATKAVPRSER
jgi:hypothetical protein